MRASDKTKVLECLVSEPTPRRLALLIAAPWPGETAMHNDLVAMYDSLRLRGFLTGEILALEGFLSRRLLLAFLRAASTQTADWPDGELFLHYSGHGGFWPWDAADASQARPALLLDDRSLAAPERWLFWDELILALNLPPGVYLTLLPDC